VDKAWVFTNLAHLIDMDLLREAFRLTRKDGAPGIDGVTGKEYARNWKSSLEDLCTRLQTGRYRATPVMRAWIGKEDGSKRPIGKPCFEDKIVQRAVVILLTQIYEQDFYSFSYGFRPGKSAHQAVNELWHICMRLQGGTIVDADICGFFDNLDRGVLREFVERRMKDGGIHRLIGKWLNAGVLDGGELINPETGTPQGGVISPLLANIYLHYVVDEWFAEVVRPRLYGRAELVRFADDFVIVCELDRDAKRVLKALRKRLSKYGLELHPEKTRLVKFRKPEAFAKTSKASGNGTFDFLGFTYYWIRSRQGKWVVRRRTMKSRLRRSIRSLWTWCKENRHMPLPEQHKALKAKLHGIYAYYGIRCNCEALETVYYHALRAWQKWLSRRSRKSKIWWSMFHEKIERIFPLPKPRIVHANV
jgi:group II intron reverse transcriptase/maturase